MKDIIELRERELIENLAEEEIACGKSAHDAVCSPLVSFFAFPTKMSMPPFSAFCLCVMRNNPISLYWLTHLLYRVQYYTIRTMNNAKVEPFDIYFITLFFSTCQVRVKLVFVQSRPFYTPLLSNAA